MTEVAEHLWSTFSNVWPPSWILFLITMQKFSCCSTIRDSCATYQHKSLYHSVSRYVANLCSIRTALLRKLRALGIFSTFMEVVNNPWNWKNIRPPVVGPNCKFHLLAEGYSPVNSPSFHWQGKKIRRRKTAAERSDEGESPNTLLPFTSINNNNQI